MSSYYEKILATGEVKCIDEEIPFEIPQGWEWCRLGTIAEIIGGYAFPSLMLKGDTGTRVIRISDFTEHGLTKSRIVRYNGVAISDLYTIQISDILMAMTGGTVGKSCYIKSLPEKLLLNQRVAVIRNQYMNSEYINLIVESPHIIAFVNDRKNSTNDNISMKDIYNFLIPIPSIKQQERIVNAFNSIRPIIKRFAQVQENKEKLQNEVKDKLRKSILHEAIQGKLVPQISEEGTAQDLLQVIKEEKQKLFKEGKLKKSALNDSVIFRSDDNKYYEQIGKKCLDVTDEIPFVIPETWQWVRIRDVFQLNPKNEADDETLAAFIPMEKVSAGYKSDFTFDLVKWGNIKKRFTHFANGDVAFAKITPCFQNRKSAIFHDLPNGIGAGTTELKVLRPYGNTIDRWYLLYFLESPYFIDEATFKGTANQQRIVVGYLEDKLFPLPTQKEQQRIVAQIEKLFEQLR